MQQLSRQESAVCRTFFEASLAEAGLEKVDLADEVFPLLSPAKLYRRFAADASFTLEELDVILELGGPVLGFDPERVRQMLDNPFCVDLLPEAELACAKCFSIDNEEITAVLGAADQAIAGSKRAIIVSANLPNFLLEPEIGCRVTAHLCRHARNPQNASPMLQAVRDEWRESFMNYEGIARVPEVIVPVGLSTLLRLRRCRQPYRGCEPDHVDACFESLKHDAPERGVRLAILNDLVDGDPQRWVRSHLAYDLVAAFDGGILMKRRRRSLVVRVVRREESPLARWVFDSHWRALTQSTGFICHGPSAQGTAKFLDELLDASGDGAGRGPSTN